MRILIWHVHGSWMRSFVSGRHEYLVPKTSARDADGAGVPQGVGWSTANVVEVTPDQLRNAQVDVVVFQREREIELATRWLRRRPGQDVPAIYLEHNTPGGDVCRTTHPLADQERIPIVHVTHFNRLFWDCGSAPNDVIELGIPDPGPLFTGTIPAAAVVINEPIRRWRATGTDLLRDFVDAVDLDVFGIKVHGLAEKLGRPKERVRENGDLPQPDLHAAIGQRRVYIHPNRWTSIGMSLIESMMIGLPVVAVAATEAGETVPPEAGVVSTRMDVLAESARAYVNDPELARSAGAAGRRIALGRFGIDRFLQDWDRMLDRVTQQ